LNISGHTKIVGILGDPVTHTLSPKMHNAAFEYLGLDYVYLPFDVKPKGLKQALDGLLGLNIVGVNVTIPHKQAALNYMDELSDDAKRLGAVNTIKVRGGRLLGANTDSQGFIASLETEADFSVWGKSILLLGAGGAARAVAFSLANMGIGRLAIANRTIVRAKELISQVKQLAPGLEAVSLSLTGDELEKYIAEAQIIINATSIGLKPGDSPPINTRLIHSGQLVYDLLYNPPQTKLLAEAQANGAKTQNGINMLIYQGALSFEIWTGKKAPLEVMRKALSI
jgi:shikimate dehydrogenase